MGLMSSLSWVMMGLFDLSPPRSFVLVFLVVLFLGDLLLSMLIVNKIKYTEIDWVAYMQEVGDENGYLSGERNYMNMKGDTGPLVYPAGFLYVYSFLFHLTNKGVDVFLGQCVFVGVYMATLAVVVWVYLNSMNGGEPVLSNGDDIGGKDNKNSNNKSRDITNYITLNRPLWIIGLIALSKRIHSIFVLRMFNDCIAVLLGYVALLCFQKHRWRLGSLVYSLAVSVKMNMLLQAPGLLMLYLMAGGLQETLVCLFICGAVQLILGFPFLSAFPLEYIMRSFDLSRVFEFKWSVNWKFLPEALFLNKKFHLALLALTVLAMAAFAVKWVGKFRERQVELKYKTPPLSANFIAITIMTSNFLGIAFARSLHYQFYVWYFHSLPLLLWSFKGMPTIARIICLASIEVAFNVYREPNTAEQPGGATWWSSALLQSSHLLLLFCIFYFPAPDPFEKPEEKEKIKTK